MKFEEPKMEILDLDLQDVICTSIDAAYSGDDDGGFN